ncbi:molecular chaperone [Scheffersomyces amazonensis]|uniref:molecular chaperone n=1 Tax=Scheffersomyces amazonensis TaxID=1078765 RepID=UPI00315C98AE
MITRSLSRRALSSRIGHICSLRFYTEISSPSTINSYFDLFPKNFPNRGPPGDSFIINDRSLRREFRGLQSENHPDILIGSSALSSGSSDTNTDNNHSDFSSIINKAYTTLRNPYNRIAHFIKLYHPQKLDITEDNVSKQLIGELNSNSPESSQNYKDMLMAVLDAHESLEMANDENDLQDLSTENDERIKLSVAQLDSIIQQQWPIQNWDNILMEAIKLKYWVNIQNGIKDWEPGKPVHLTH